MFEIGSSLREARLRQRLDVIEAEQATKIRAKYLRALEAEEFDQLPSQTYVKGFLRSYAEYLGLDGQLYVDEYNSRFVASDEEVLLRPRRSAARPRAREHRRIERNVVILALVAIAVVTALVIAAWRFGGTEETSIPNLGKSEPAKKPAARAAKKQRAAAPAAKKARNARLFVRAVGGNSLLQVRVGSASGSVLYEGTLERGQAITFEKPRLWLNVSRPENLEMRWNGRPVLIGGAAPRVLIVTAKSIRAAA